MVPSEIIALFLLEQSSKQLRSRRRAAGVDLNERVSREVQGIAIQSKAKADT